VFSASKDKFMGHFTTMVPNAHRMSAVVRNYTWDYTYTNTAKAKPHHGHANLADNRREAENNINSLCQAISTGRFGAEVAQDLWDPTNNVSFARHDVQSSGNRARSSGTWSMFSETDLLQEPRNDAYFPEYSIATFVDVIDHEGSDVHFTKHSGIPMIMYRRIPDALAGKTDESRWFTTSPGEFTEIVHQGARYTTGLWTFEDVVRIAEHPLNRGVWSMFLPRTTYYKTHTIIPHDDDPTRQIQILIPHATTSVPPPILGWLDRWGYMARCSPPTKEKFANEHGSFFMAQYDRPNSTVVSLQWQGDSSGVSCEIPSTTWLNLLAAKDRPYFTVSNVKGWLASRTETFEIENLTSDQQELLAIAILAKHQPLAYRVSTLFGRRAHIMVSETPESKLPGSHAMPPITGGAERPVLDAEASRKAVADRVDKFANTVTPPEAYEGYAREFVDLFVGAYKGRLAPNEIAEVKEAQDGKLQKVRNSKWDNEVFDVPDDITVKGSLKKETLPTGKSPRWTFTMPTQLSVLSGTFSKAWTKCFYNASHIKHFWSPGNNRDATTTQLMSFYARFPLRKKRGTDFSGWDMSQSEWGAKHVTNPLYILPFQSRYSKAATRYTVIKSGATMEMAYYNKETKSLISRLTAKGRRMSGADDTTNSNTGSNAFTDYCALRKEGFSPEVAFSMIGPKYGDDSITIADPKLLEQVAADLGYAMKWEQCDLGEEFCDAIKYLGRIYPKPADFALSFPDPIKFLRNWTLVPASNPDAMYHKWVGWMVSDGQAPGVIGNVLKTTARVLKFSLPKSVEKWQKANSNNIHKSEQRRIEFGTHPYDDMPAEMVATAMQQALSTILSDEQLALLEKKLSAASKPEDMRAVYVETCPASGEEELGVKALWA